MESNSVLRATAGQTDIHKKIDSVEIRIDITKNLKDQFDRYLNLRKSKNGFIPDSRYLIGEMKMISFPGQLTFYHFCKSQFQVPIQMFSINPKHSEWHLIHINLSQSKQEKYIDGQKIIFQKYAPAGALLFGPDLESYTDFEPFVDMELATFHFHRNFIDTYLEDSQDKIQFDKNLSFDDINIELESKLRRALESMDDKLQCHSLALNFLNAFFKKLAKHEHSNLEKIHPQDIGGLFKTLEILRNPLSTDIPSIKQLADVANMSITKYKRCFKQVFGKAPRQYFNKIRMEYAYEQLLRGRRPVEISHELQYAHPSNFTSAFKKYFSRLPSEIESQ